MKRFSVENLLFVLILLVLCVDGFGCSPVGEDVEPQRTTFWSDDPELRPYVEQMAARLSKATGRRDIFVEPGGIPVTFGKPLYFGEPVCALTQHSAYADGSAIPLDMTIDPEPPAGFCMPLVATLLHEGIHALAPNLPHTLAGIFQERAGTVSRIDSESLAALCSELACNAFEPEQD